MNAKREEIYQKILALTDVAQDLEDLLDDETVGGDLMRQSVTRRLDDIAARIWELREMNR